MQQVEQNKHIAHIIWGDSDKLTKEYKNRIESKTIEHSKNYQYHPNYLVLLVAG